MASSSSSAAEDDGPSTSGRRSGRRQQQRQFWDFAQPKTTTILLYSSEKDLALQKLLIAVMDLDIVKARKCAEKLIKLGTGIDEAVANLATRNRLSKGHGPLHVAASTNLVSMCKMLVKDFHCNLNVADGNGSTPLFYAILGGGSQALVEYLITSGADPKKANNREMTPLHCAAGQGYCEIAEYLLSKGVDIDPICYSGEAPLHIAARCGSAKMVKLLLQHEANTGHLLFNFLEVLSTSQFKKLSIPGLARLNTLSHDLHTPLVASLVGCSLGCFEAFIEAGANINTGSPVTPLSVAARKGLAECINCLLGIGADPNEPDEDGKLPVQIAASKLWREGVDILLPVTNLLGRYANTPSAAEVIEQESTARQDEEMRAIADGDVAYWEKNYAHALRCYTKALRLGHVDRELYAKRSLCHLRNYDEHRYLDDAMAYMDMRELDLSKHPEEQAKQSVLEYAMKWKAPTSTSGCNLTDETGKASREEDR